MPEGHPVASLAQIRAVALNTVQETLRKRVLHVVAVLMVLILLGIFSQQRVLQMAADAGEMTMIANLRAEFVRQAMGLWDFAAAFLALFLGAMGVVSEINARTIVNVLARPIERSAYLAGRWFGTLVFLWGFQLLGIGLAVAIARSLDVQYTAMFWSGCVEMLALSWYYSGVSLGLSVFLPPILAGGGAFLLIMLPAFVGGYLQHPQWALRLLANL